MPRIPYQPFATTVPEVSGRAFGERLDIAVSPDQFGANVGAAMQHLGATVEKSGDELFSRAVALQQVYNQAAARDAVTQHMTYAAGKLDDYSSTKGRDAVDQLHPFLNDLDNHQKSVRETLTTPEAKRFYDQDIASFQRSTVLAASKHAGAEHKDWVMGSADAAIKLNNATVVDPDNDIGFQQKLKINQRNANDYNAAGGLHPDDPQAQLYLLKAQSGAWLARVVQKSHTDALGAMAMLETARDTKQITQTDYNAALDMIRNQNRAVGTNNLANMVYSPDKPYAQALSDARSLTKERGLDLGDPRWDKDLQITLRGKYFNDRWQKRTDDAESLNMILQTIQTKDIKSLQQLRADPKMAQLLDSNPTLQQRAPALIHSWLVGKDAFGQKERYNYLSGLAGNDREKFLDTPPESWDVNQDQFRELSRIRNSLLNKQREDPRVIKMMGWLRDAGQLPDGLATRNSLNEKQYDTITGALQAAVEDWIEVHKTPPTYKDVIEQIGPAVLGNQTLPKSKFLGIGVPFTGGQQPTYEFIDDYLRNHRDEINLKAAQQGQPYQSDLAIRQAVMKLLHKNLFGASSGKKPPGPPSP